MEHLVALALTEMFLLMLALSGTYLKTESTPTSYLHCYLGIAKSRGTKNKLDSRRGR